MNTRAWRLGFGVGRGQKRPKGTDMRLGRGTRWLVGAWLALPMGALAQTGPVQISDPEAVPENVWSHDRSACSDTDYSDVPVRPFYGRRADGAGWTLYWFASNATGYLATEGVEPVPGSDILAGMARIRAADGTCVAWLKAGPYSEPPARPANGVPDSYNTDLWMVAPFTPDGRRVFALLHNEFHGELTAPPGKPSIYCTITQATPLPGQACGYWNIVGAGSRDGGATFKMRKKRPGGDYNAPEIALPLPYRLPANNGGVNPAQSGMVAQSNIIQWGTHYYVLVQQKPLAAPAAVPGAPQAIGANGTCLYRTDDLGEVHAWRGWDGHAFTVPVVAQYPAGLADPGHFTCTPVLNGMYRFSWSYNTVLRNFIVLGVDTDFGGTATEAFVYTILHLDPDGHPAQVSGERFLRAIAWFDRWSADPTVTGEAYPSLLDPTSPEIVAYGAPNRTPGDLNFQYSGAHPYLYFTLLHPWENAPHRTDRDVVRQALTVRLGNWGK